MSSPPPPPLDRAQAVKLSKLLSYVLRHGAAKEGLQIRPDGYVTLSELLARPKFKNVTFEQIEHVVKTNDKQRFSLIQDNDGQQWWIRANQGHSIRHAIDPDALLERLSEPLPVVIHGTTMHNWRNGIQEQGLRVMNRQHIHFATGLPGTDGVISGMRSSSEVFIYIDMAKAIKDGIIFYRSSNNVILTEGIGGTLPPTYFQKVTNRNGESLLLQPE